MSTYRFVRRLPSLRVSKALLISLEEVIAAELKPLLKGDNDDWKVGFSLTCKDASGSESFHSANELPNGKLRDGISSIDSDYMGRGCLLGVVAIAIQFRANTEAADLRVTLTGQDARLRASRLADAVEVACANHRAHNEWICSGGTWIDMILICAGVFAMIRNLVSLQPNNPPFSPVAIAVLILVVLALYIRNVCSPYSVLDTTRADLNADRGKWLSRLLLAGIIITPFINYIKEHWLDR